MLAPFSWFNDEWLLTRRAVKLFLAAAIILVVSTPLLWGLVDVKRMSFWTRLPWGCIGLLCPVALIFLWAGMWRYWIRLDDSTTWTKRVWFVVLLVGFWYGSFAYYFLVYRPQVLRRKWA